ncbi:hypothetical protein HD554DRAFT_1413094 [Boletus coccyginus]|nr:hypothetical protein HD554DRAFT_1413094 [Boletus coccyginus]
MENRRTPDEDLALSSTGAPSTTRSGIPNLHQSSATHPSTSLSSLRHSRLPAHSALSHSHSTHPSSGDRSLQPPATSSYPPTTSAPTNANRPLSSTSPSTSSMIVSALSFYDPTQASVVPQYQHLSRWDAPFAPSLSDAIDNSITSRDPAFIAGNNPDSASGSGGDFQFVRSAAGFDFHRANDPSGGGPQLPSHSQQQHRQIVPIPRRQRGPPHHDPTNVQGQGQVERREQRRVEGQTQERSPAPQALANQRLQELLTLPPSHSYSLPEHSRSQSHRTQSQSQEHPTALSTSQDQPRTSDAHSAPVAYHIQGAPFSLAPDFVTTQNNPYTGQYYHSSAGSEADVGITVEHVNEPVGPYYDVQASHSLSSLHDAYPPPSGAYPHTHAHSSPHSNVSGFTPPTHSNTPASDSEPPRPRPVLAYFQASCPEDDIPSMSLLLLPGAFARS